MYNKLEKHMTNILAINIKVAKAMKMIVISNSVNLLIFRNKVHYFLVFR